MSVQGSKPVSGAEEQNVDFGQLTVPAQRLEEMINWHMIHGAAERSGYITVDVNRLAQIAGTAARFPLDATGPAHAIFLEEGMQKYRDSLSEDDVNIESLQHLENDWRNFWAEDNNISLGMKNIVSEMTLGWYRQLAKKLFDKAGTTKISDGMHRAAVLTQLVERIEGNEFGYNHLHDLQTLAGMVTAEGPIPRIAWHLIGLLAEGALPAHKLHAFSIMDLAAEGENNRLNLLDRLAAFLTMISYASDAKAYDTIVGKTLDLLKPSRLTPDIERDLLDVIDKMLDPSTYPPENSRLRDEQGNILTKSSDVDKLIVDFLDALGVQTTVAGSLPARLLALTADPAVKVNGAFITLAQLSLRQSTRGGTLASYYGEPLFDHGVRAKLADLSFSQKNINAVDYFLEEEVYDVRRGGGSLPPMPGGPMYFHMPAGTWGMSAAGMGTPALTSIGMFTGMPMSTMPLTIGII